MNVDQDYLYAEGSSEGKHNGLTSGRLSEGSIPKKTEHFQKIDGDIKKRKEDQSWSAHRADDGAVRYMSSNPALSNKCTSIALCIC